MRLAATLAFAGCALSSEILSAQRIEARFGPATRAVAKRAGGALPGPWPGLRAGALGLPRRDSSWWVPLASAVLPGAGQALLGQDRSVAYLAVEGYVLLDYLKTRTEETRERDRSRALARDVARARFSTIRPIGSWAYYESMEQYLESGVFDLFPGSAVLKSPESDPTTFNGFIWEVARKTYWPRSGVQPDDTTAAYKNSRIFYSAHAVRDEYYWSWRNAQLEQDLFRRAIFRRNAASREATTLLGILTLNHLLSTVDAFVTLRLRGGAGAGDSPTSLEATLPWAPFGRHRPR